MERDPFSDADDPRHEDAQDIDSSDNTQIAGQPEPAGSTLEDQEDDTESTLGSWKPDPEKLFQSLVFASPEFLHYKVLREIMGEEWDVARLRQLAKAVNLRMVENEEPFEIIEINGTFRFRTLTRYYPWVRKLFKDQSPRRLSQAALETLAIVAYKQPITKAEVEAIRGVNVDGSLKSLLDKKLIDISGRSDAIGSAFTYATTQEFMKYFGINKVPDDLPRLSEFEELVNAQALIPQIRPSGEVAEGEQVLEDPNQLDMGI